MALREQHGALGVAGEDRENFLLPLPLRQCAWILCDTYRESVMTLVDLRGVSIAGAIMLMTCSAAWGQDGPKERWVNQELLKSNMPTAQYNALGRGDLAACRSDATIAVQRTLSTHLDCAGIDQNLMGGMYGLECGQRQRERQTEREQLFRDLALGCMAKKGWILVSAD